MEPTSKIGSIKVFYQEIKTLLVVSDLEVVRTLEVLQEIIKIFLEEALVSLMVLAMDQGLDQTILGRVVFSIARWLTKVQALCILMVHLSFKE